MPNFSEAPVVEQVDLNQADFILALQKMKDSYALSLVNQTFRHFETYRQQNHDTRWLTNDALYVGWIPQRVWDGTNIPRSSLPMQIVFDQIETVMPAIMQALFGQPDWFQVEADSGSDPRAARAIKARLLYILEHDKDEFGLTLLNDIELAIKSMLIYGNGGVAVEWDAAKNQPTVSWVDNRDVYFDPSTNFPAVDHCRSVIRQSLKTVEEVLAWSETPGMKIPSKEILWAMANSRHATAGNTTKEVQSSLLGYGQTANTDALIALPADHRLEVLTYYSKDRIIIVLNREWVAFVATNPYGFIPLAFAPCYIVPGKFYAMSIADVQEGNQRYIEALMNSHIDELHLSLHPPRVQKASSLLTPNQQKWAPGRVFKAADPKNDFVALTPSGATTNVFDGVNFIQLLSEKRTGINSMGQGGIPQPSNANRTGMGMQMQMQGSASRLQMLVKHIEDYLLVPILYKIYKLTQIHSTQPQIVPGKLDGELQNVNTAAFSQAVQFKIKASSQMLTRDKLSQIFPYLIQYMTAGPFIQGLAQTGLTIDWGEMFQLLQDATGISRSYTLVRSLNEQEQKQLNQPSPDAQAEQQKSQMEAQLRMQIATMSNETDLKKAMIAKQPNPAEAQAAQQKLELDMMREQMKLQVEQQKLEIEQQKAAMQLQLKRMEMQMKAQEMQMKAIMGQQQAQQNMAIKTQQADLDTQLARQQHDVAMVQTQQSLQQNQAQHEQKLKQIKEAQALKPASPSKK